MTNLHLRCRYEVYMPHKRHWRLGYKGWHCVGLETVELQSTHFAPRNAYEWDAHTGDVVTFGLPAWVWRCTLSKQMPDTCEPGLQRHRWVWSIYITRCMHPICCTRTLQTHSIAESLLLYRRGVGQLRVQFLSLPKRSVALVTTTRKGGRQSSYK